MTNSDPNDDATSTPAQPPKDAVTRDANSVSAFLDELTANRTRFKNTEPQALASFLSRLKEQMSPPKSIETDIGGAEPIPDPEVDIALYPSRATPVAGELWSIAGEIYNRSQHTVWIVDRTTRLTLAPEMYGLSSQTGSIGAFFPTVAARPTDEVVRIDPGAKYEVTWKLDPLSTREEVGAKQPLRKRIWSALRNYAFFNPGTFRVSSTILIWPKPPTIDKSGFVNNIGDAFAETVAKDVPMDSSQWVLIAGATIGGALCFFLQVFLGINTIPDTLCLAAKAFMIGLCTSMLLCGVSTVLIARLSTLDFPIVLRVKDIWGAFATGFVIQWFGYGFIKTALSAMASK